MNGRGGFSRAGSSSEAMRRVALVLASLHAASQALRSTEIGEGAAGSRGILVTSSQAVEHCVSRTSSPWPRGTPMSDLVLVAFEVVSPALCLKRVPRPREALS